MSTLCTRSRRSLPILTENGNNHHIVQRRGGIGSFSLEVVDLNERKCQIRRPYVLASSIISNDERYKYFFLPHSTVPAPSSDKIRQIMHGTEDSFVQQASLVGHCIIADARMSKRFGHFLPRKLLVSDEQAAKGSSS